VFPVTAVVLGHPAEDPVLRDRLLLEVIAHQEKYQRLTDKEILVAHADRERKAWARYNLNEELREKLVEAGITRVTDYYTSVFKYSKELHQQVSEMLIKTLQEQCLWL
jgi:phenylalanyl-tRNA synthetase beta subunit